MRTGPVPPFQKSTGANKKQTSAAERTIERALTRPAEWDPSGPRDTSVWTLFRSTSGVPDPVAAPDPARWPARCGSCGAGGAISWLVEETAPPNPRNKRKGADTC